MAKEYYDVSYKTYFNDRIKPVVFGGKKSYPLYIQLTYDRKTIFFKSYYFEVFARPKYSFLRTSVSQIEKLESGIIDYIVLLNAEGLSLDGRMGFLSQYKALSMDLLDSLDGPFRKWLAGFLMKAGYPGMAATMEYAPDVVASVRLWDELRKMLDRGIFEKMEDEAACHAPPYMLLAEYVRSQSPGGPFCLPLFEWFQEKKRVEMEVFFNKTFRKVDMEQAVRAVKLLYTP